MRKKILVLFLFLVMFMFLVSCAPALTDKELEAELSKLTPEQREELLKDLEAKESGALAGQAYAKSFAEKSYYESASPEFQKALRTKRVSSEGIKKVTSALVYCGNGGPNSLESCDDGNNENNDGCSSFCKIEPNFKCTEAYAKDPSIGWYVPSICTPIQPDLVVFKEISYVLRTNESGTYVWNITVSVKNLGAATTTDFHTLFDSFPFGSFFDTTSSLLNFGDETYPGWKNKPYLCTVDHNVVVTVDAYQNKIVEFDETNNKKTLAVKCS